MASRPFSVRHRKAIRDKLLPVSLQVRLRRRVWQLLQQYDHEVGIQPDPFDSWVHNSSAIVETEAELKRIYGEDELIAFSPPGSPNRAAVDLQRFVLGAYPTQVLDTVEVFEGYLTDHDSWKLRFQKDLNAAFGDEGCPWRLSDGQFFKVDSEFLAVEVLERAEELLKANGFQGSVDELRQARNDLASADHKGAIVNACNAFESTLKTTLGRQDGAARELLRAFVEKGYCDDIPEPVRAGFRDQVLQSLPFIRNKLAGHGQGEQVVEVPKTYAELAVHLAGSLIQFVIGQALARNPQEQPATPSPFDDDNVPF